MAITSASTSITANVSRYSRLLTANVNRGGTKQKSSATTFATAAKLAGPRPSRKAATVAPSRYTIARLVSAKYGYMTAATAVQHAEIASAAQ